MVEIANPVQVYFLLSIQLFFSFLLLLPSGYLLCRLRSCNSLALSRFKRRLVVCISVDDDYFSFLFLFLLSLSNNLCSWLSRLRYRLGSSLNFFPLFLLFLFFKLFHHQLILFLSLFLLVLSIEITFAALTFVITTPAVNFALHSHSDGMMFATCHHCDSLALESLNKSGGTDVFLVSHTQLTMVVESPSKDLASFVDIE